MTLTDEFVKQDALTALMITHHMEDALKYGNRLIVMKDGHIVQDLSQEEKAQMTIADYYQLFEKRLRYKARKMPSENRKLSPGRLTKFIFHTAFRACSLLKDTKPVFTAKWK